MVMSLVLVLVEVGWLADRNYNCSSSGAAGLAVKPVVSRANILLLVCVWDCSAMWACCGCYADVACAGKGTPRLWHYFGGPYVCY